MASNKSIQAPGRGSEALTRKAHWPAPDFWRTRTMNMKINDPDKLIPNHDVIYRIVNSHPLGHDLEEDIDTLLVHRSAKGPSIKFDNKSHIATLYLSENDHTLNNYEYILYHEFSHIVDRTKLAFGYSDEKKKLLSDCEQLCVMELWNIYIDARLNCYHLFQLGKNDENIYCRINGRLQKAPFTIEGKLLCHISFLTSRGVGNADSIVRDLWQNPEKDRPYDDLIKLIKENIG